MVGIEHGEGLPSFRLHIGGRALRATIIHYEGNCHDEVTMSRLCWACPNGISRSSLYSWLNLGLQGDCVSGKYIEP